MNKAFIIDGLRTPIGGVNQSLKGISSPALGAIVIKKLLKKGNLDNSLVDEVIMGNVVGAGLGQNPARQSQIKAGLPANIPAFTVNKVCGSGLKAVILASQAISCSDADLIIAGGIENSSQCPYTLAKNKKSAGLATDELKDSLINDGLWCSLSNMHMGTIAEYTAKKFKIPRKQQDEYALKSHQKACWAQKQGFLKKEIVPIRINNKVILSADEKPRKNLSLERLAKLPSAFKVNGSITAGNASAPADGAAGLIVASQNFIKKRLLKSTAQILGYAYAAVEPKLAFTAPALAIQKCLKECGLKVPDIDIFEVNEAFSAQALLTIQLVKLPVERMNIFGGTLAFGHPLGASGAKGLVTLINALKTKKGKIGLTTICLGGGCALALAICLS